MKQGPELPPPPVFALRTPTVRQTEPPPRDPVPTTAAGEEGTGPESKRASLATPPLQLRRSTLPPLPGRPVVPATTTIPVTPSLGTLSMAGSASLFDSGHWSTFVPPASPATPLRRGPVALAARCAYAVAVQCATCGMVAAVVVPAAMVTWGITMGFDEVARGAEGAGFFFNRAAMAAIGYLFGGHGFGAFMSSFLVNGWYGVAVHLGVCSMAIVMVQAACLLVMARVAPEWSYLAVTAVTIPAGIPYAVLRWMLFRELRSGVPEQALGNRFPTPLFVMRKMFFIGMGYPLAGFTFCAFTKYLKDIPGTALPLNIVIVVIQTVSVSMLDKTTPAEMLTRAGRANEAEIRESRNTCWVVCLLLTAKVMILKTPRTTESFKFWLLLGIQIVFERIYPRLTVYIYHVFVRTRMVRRAMAKVEPLRKVVSRGRLARPSLLPSMSEESPKSDGSSHFLSLPSLAETTDAPVGHHDTKPPSPVPAPVPASPDPTRRVSTALSVDAASRSPSRAASPRPSRRFNTRVAVQSAVSALKKTYDIGRTEYAIASYSTTTLAVLVVCCLAGEAGEERWGWGDGVRIWALWTGAQVAVEAGLVVAEEVWGHVPQSGFRKWRTFQVGIHFSMVVAGFLAAYTVSTGEFPVMRKVQ
ncbi:hypothetical protein HDU96_001032 [Phlyctochytrium bullatum]|nr:hypothetical protein HDU96_001032 [Phlyctochytrium bullatum]